jgi:diguanylate cyclase (GGDEF)-like protein
MTPANFLSTQHLVEFLAVVSTATNEQSAARRAAECAAQMLEAEFAAVVIGERLVTTVGFPRGHAPVGEIVQAAGTLRGSIAVPGVGDCMTAVGRASSDCPLSLLVARLPGEGFTVEEANLVRGMGWVLDLTMGMIRTLEAERELHERSKLQAMDNAELLGSLQDRQRLLEQLSLVQRAISRHDPLVVIFEMIVSSARDLIGGDEVTLRLCGPGDSSPRLIASSAGFADRALGAPPGPMTAALDVGARAMETNGVARSDPAGEGGGPTDGQSRVSVVAAPVHEGLTTVGVLSFEARPGRSGFDAEDEAMLVALADHVSLALSDARTVEQMRLARHDSLTGLASRPLFLEKLAQSLEEASDGGGQVAVLFIDLDRFKAINDTAGHATGDRLLAEVGRRIAHSLRASEVAARFGGDEFAVLLSGDDCLPLAIAVADRLLTDLSAPYSIGNRQLHAGASIGIATSAGSDNAEDLMRDADAAMYQAKQKGRGRFSVFEPDMHEWFVQRA